MSTSDFRYIAIFVVFFFFLQETHEEHDTSTENADDSNHDPQFEPIVSLPEQEIKTLEEDEEELFKMQVEYFCVLSKCSLDLNLNVFIKG